MPEITTSGKNTFGCRVNGKILIPSQGTNGAPITQLYYIEEALTVLAVKKGGGIHLSVQPIVDTGYFDFSLHKFKMSDAFYQKDDTIFTDYGVSFGYIHILRFDLKAGIIAGTFAFDAYSAMEDTVHITDGRFDLPIQH